MSGRDFLNIGTTDSLRTFSGAPDAFALYTQPQHSKQLRKPLAVSLGGTPASAAQRMLKTRPVKRRHSPESRPKPGTDRIVEPYSHAHEQMMATSPTEVLRVPGEVLLSPDGKSCVEVESPIMQLHELEARPQTTSSSTLGKWGQKPKLRMRSSTASASRKLSRLYERPASVSPTRLREPHVPEMDLTSLAPFKLFSHYRRLRELLPELIQNDEADLLPSASRLAGKDSHSTDLILEHDPDFLRRAQSIALEVSKLEQVNRRHRTARADNLLLSHRHFFPALPRLFVEALRSGTDWWQQLQELKSEFGPLQTNHDDTVRRLERVEARLVKEKAAREDEQKHQQARIEAGVQFEKIKLDMLQVRMQNQLNEQVEIAEIAKSDAKLLDMELNYARDEIVVREDRIAVLEQTISELQVVETSLKESQHHCSELEIELSQANNEASIASNEVTRLTQVAADEKARADQLEQELQRLKEDASKQGDEWEAFDRARQGKKGDKGKKGNKKGSRPGSPKQKGSQPSSPKPQGSHPSSPKPQDGPNHFVQARPDEYTAEIDTNLSALEI